MLDDAIARLYSVPPGEFTGVRAQLVAQARADGDTDAAKALGALRKPSTAAWVVNLLAQQDGAAVDRLGAVGDELRAAHAALDPDRIRELSTARRRLVDELARKAFAAAGLANPTAAVRDDVTGTLQAAIADPAVAARLGRLSKAERWSGFGDVVDQAPPTLRVVQGGRSATATTTKTGIGTPAPSTAGAKRTTTQRDDQVAEAKQDLQLAAATVAAAEQSRSDAEDELAEREAERAAARIKRDEAHKRLHEAELRLEQAERNAIRAAKVVQEADELVRAAKAAQRRSRDTLDAVRKQRP